MIWAFLVGAAVMGVGGTLAVLGLAYLHDGYDVFFSPDEIREWERMESDGAPLKSNGKN